MYRRLVERRVRRAFERLSEGDYETALSDVADDVHHVFAGDGAIGGQRHSKQAMRRWFERVFRLFPDPTFEVKNAVARGWPWNTVVAVEWTDHVRPLVGEPYVNEGVHIVRIRWGRVVSIHAYPDTEKIRIALERMAAAGVDEASQRPITN